MGFYFRAEYELIFIVLFFISTHTLICFLFNKFIESKQLKECLDGRHKERVTTNDHHYTFKKCRCGKNWTLINKR